MVFVFDSDVLFTCIIFIVYIDTLMVECIMFKLSQTIFIYIETFDSLVVIDFLISHLLR